MTLAALIRKRESGKVATAIPAISATQPTEEMATVARIATVAVAIPTETQTATASRCWLLHYTDREPVEVASFPTATHADILERHPEAIAAEPFEPATPEPTRACSSCAHACRSGCCGEPVAAGLSDLPGVIRYHPDQGATCPAWLATIPGDLEARIRSMAERWGHSGDDLALVLDAARQDPEGWLRMFEVDDRGGPGNGE